jgi:hypothetical protein
MFQGFLLRILRSYTDPMLLLRMQNVTASDQLDCYLK